jgi:hypothetical protein
MMDINNEFFIHLESTFNRLLYNNDINQLKFYSELYNYSLKIQKLKHTDSRNDIIVFYNDVLDKVAFIIDNFLNNMFDKIVGSKELLQTYSIEFNIFNDSLITINSLMEYFKNELTKLDTTYKELNYINYGLTKWFEYITFKLIKYINTKLCYYLDFRNKELTSLESDTNIYYLSEILDTIFYWMNKNIISQSIFNNAIRSFVIEFLNKNIEELNKNILDDPHFLKTIDACYIFQLNSLNELNLELLIDDYEDLFKTLILDKYENLIKQKFTTMLNDFNFKTFRTNYIINDDFYMNVKLCLEYCVDTNYIKDKLTKWLNNLIICATEFDEILDLNYFITMIVDKIEWKLESVNSDIFNKIFNIFEPYFKDMKETMENFDKYIRGNVYKNNLIPINYFHKTLINYFTKYSGSGDDSYETIFIYFKNYLVKRLYYYNFDEDYIKHELDIITSLTDNLNTTNLYKLNIIKNDLLGSKHITNEFNSIYNQTNNLIVMTDGIWNISPKTYEFSNTEFNRKFNTFKTEFTTFYNCKFENKKLDWNHQLSSCTLNYINNNKEYEIECPLNIANILYEFNDTNILSFNESSSKDFDILCQYKLIKKDSSNNHYVINERFNYKGSKITIKNNGKNKRIIKKQQNEIVFSQKELVELYIMRTVKRVSIISDEELNNMINEKFNISNDLIKETFEKLIDNEYLKYDNNKYLYVI